MLCCNLCLKTLMSLVLWEFIVMLDCTSMQRKPYCLTLLCENLPMEMSKLMLA